MCSQAWAGDIKMITLNSLCHTSKWHPKLACIYRPLGTEKVYRSDLSLECLARSSLWTFLYGNWVYSKHILSRPTFPSNSPVSHALLSEWNLQFCKRLGLESCTMTVRLVSSSMAKALNYCPVSEASGWLDVLHLVFFYLAEIWDSCLGGWLERVVTFPPLYCHSLSLVIFHNSQSFFFFPSRLLTYFGSQQEEQLVLSVSTAEQICETGTGKEGACHLSVHHRLWYVTHCGKLNHKGKIHANLDSKMKL